MLTLVSNERIPLNDSMRMVFEIHSLKNATPATVSRAGILYINETDIGFLPYVNSWLHEKSSAPEFAALKSIFEVKLPLVIDFYKKSKVDTVVPLPMINLVQSLCSIFEGLLNAHTGDRSHAVYERIFVFSTMWAFGGAYSREKQVDPRKAFSTFLRELTAEVKFPEEGLAYDYFIDFSSGEASSWGSQLTLQSFSGSEGSAQVFVQTVDSVRLSYLMDVLVRNCVPVMFVGPAGTGKTVLVNDYLTSLSASDEKYKSSVINMNYYTDSLSLQR
jgi:dynein heavy chain